MAHERAVSAKYYFLVGFEENFFWQKFRIKWLQVSDYNTVYFFNSLKRRYNRHHIALLELKDGTITNDNKCIKNESSAIFRSFTP